MLWEGWNESAVRLPQQAAADSSRSIAPATTGFTAINSSLPAQQPISTVADCASATRHAADHGQHATVASAYLGRGTNDMSATISKHGPKAAANKGKKRATTAPDSKSSKRHKTGNDSRATPASRPRAGPKRQTATSSKVTKPTNVAETALQHEQLLKSAKQTSKSSRQANQQTAEAADPTPASALVSVISPSTSMKTMQSSSQQTAFDAVQSSFGHGAMLYDSSSSPKKQQCGITLAPPLLHPAKAALGASFRNHARDGENSDAGEPNDEFPDDDEVDFGSLFDELAQQSEGNAGQNLAVSRSETCRVTQNAAKERHEPSSRTASRTVGDGDLIDDDDDLADAMAEAEIAATTPMPAKRLSVSARQLATPARASIAEQQAATTDVQCSEYTSKEDDDEDEDMIEFEKVLKEVKKAGLEPQLRRQKTRNVDVHEDYGGALLDVAEKQLLIKLRSATQDSGIKPIVRDIFPQPVLDRSPIFGATNTAILRTCFRLGEAFNAGCHAVRANKTVILEIYGRVTSSFRKGRKQHLVLKDLYHDKPPHLEGDFELWNQSRLWDLDGKAFLNARENADGVMCRAVARMKGNGTKWRLEVLNIWKATWEDVEAVAGVYVRGGTGVGHDED